MSEGRQPVRLALLLSLGWVVGLALILVPVAKGQEEETGWSAPELVVQTTGQVAVTSMALVADQAGSLHLFFPHKPDERSLVSIDHVSWDGSAWSRPVDVLVTELDGVSALTRAAIDSRQVIPLLWIACWTSRLPYWPMCLVYNCW